MNSIKLGTLQLAALALFAVTPGWSQSTDTTKGAANGRPAPSKQAASPSDPAADSSMANSPGVGDESITLTPFEVSTAKDRGYYASNTLSGTRIASKVEDLASSITVITKQQLIDTAAVDINDIFRYESNTEGLFDFTPTNLGAVTTDTGQTSPTTSNRIRGLTVANLAVDNFSHASRIPIDTYNLSSVEISRGPNSTLFGLGSPSGTVNSNLNQANLSREITSFSLRADSYGGWRASFDLNRPLWKNKLAIRIDGVESDGAFPQKPSYDNMKRLYAAMTYQPFKYTTIKLNAETYHENRQTPNTLTPRDGISEWLANGSPTWNPLTQQVSLNGVPQAYMAPAGTVAGTGLPYIVNPAGGAATVFAIGSGATAENSVLPLGLAANSINYTRPSMFISGGQVELWEIGRLDTTTNPNQSTNSNVRLVDSGSVFMRGLVNGGNLYNVPGTNNKALYDWTSINAVSTNWNSDKAAIYEAVFEQRIIDNLYFRAGWRLEDSDGWNWNINNPPTLEIDVNQTLVDGRANPYFLRPYIQVSEPTIFRQPDYNDSAQAYLTYEFDLTHEKGLLKWLGHHRLLGYYENRRVTDGTFRFREAIIDPNHVWETAGALNYSSGPTVNRPTYRYYVGPSGAVGYVDGYQPPKAGTAGNFNLNYNNAATNQWISDPATFGLASYVASQTKQETTSRGGVLQSYFLDDRIVYTGGLRKDFSRSRASNGAVINGNTGMYDNGPLSTWGPWSEGSGNTRLNSLVVKPFRWLGLLYDRSTSFQIQPRQVNNFGQLLPNTYAHGQDYGFWLKTLDEKFEVKLTFYKTTILNDRNTDTTLAGRLRSLEAVIGNANNFSLASFAINEAVAHGLVSGTPQYDAYVGQVENFLPGTAAAYGDNSSLSATNNTEGKGAELELTYNPTTNWNIKFTGAQTITKNTTLATDLQEYIASRVPYWNSLTYDYGTLAGQPWFTTTPPGGGQTPAAYYTTNVASRLALDQALLGKSNPQVKKYTWRLISKYRFATGMLKNLEVGGTAAWNDKSVIGYLGAAPNPLFLDSQGRPEVVSLDVNKPVYDPARYSFDFFTSYSFKMFSRIGTRVQLNVKNAFENGGLRPTAINPDGTVYNWRIINPRQFVLQTTFDF